jgi:hypothetical protein
MNFQKGFSKLTMLTSDEWVGKLFILLIVLHTEEGRDLFESKRLLLMRIYQTLSLIGGLWTLWTVQVHFRVWQTRWRRITILALLI